MMVLAASDMRGAKVNKNEGEHAGCECIEHMSCLQRNEGEHVCVGACLSPWYNPGDYRRKGGFQGKERENHSLWGTHKKCECARCYPMHRRSSDQRYVAYSLTLKRDEKTLMNRHVMNEKTSQHNDDFQTNNDEAV